MTRLSDTPVLTTPRLTLRAPVASDWPHWCDFMASERARFVGGGPAVKATQIWRAFGHVIGHWVLRGWGMFVFSRHDDDTPLGMTGPWFPEGWPEREIGWSLWSEDAQGKGYAFEAAAAARDHAFDVLGWSGAVSYIAPENQRSIALAKRLGAQRDDGAATPDFDDRCLVYRHRAPDDRAPVRRQGETA